jgi:hypothetical protein
MRVANRAVIALLLAGISVPLIGTALGLDLMPEGNALRRPVPCPKLAWKWDALRRFPDDFQAFFHNHFGFRGPLIRALSFAKVRGLGASSSINVQLGKNDWLYYNHLPAGSDYQEVRPFSPEELAEWARVLERRQAWLERRHCRYLLFIPPDKQTIYPENVNPALRPRHASGRLDQLLDYLRGHSTVRVVDVRDQLRQARQTMQVYYATDSHWNPRGAFIGYEALAAVLAEWFPQVQPLTRSQFEEQSQIQHGGDLAALLDLRDCYPEERMEWRPKFVCHSQKSPFAIERPRIADMPFGPPLATQCSDTALPRAVVFHDSFALALTGWLAEHFQWMVTVWHDDFHQEVVEQQHPDVVIQELLERKLGHVVPNDIADGQ